MTSNSITPSPSGAPVITTTCIGVVRWYARNVHVFTESEVKLCCVFVDKNVKFHDYSFIYSIVNEAF